MTTQAATLGKAIPWQVDPAHTHVEFAVRHLMIATVRGRFSDVTGTVIVPDGTSHALSSRRRLASRASIHVSRSGTRI